MKKIFIIQIGTALLFLLTKLLAGKAVFLISFCLGILGWLLLLLLPSLKRGKGTAVALTASIFLLIGVIALPRALVPEETKLATTLIIFLEIAILFTLCQAAKISFKTAILVIVGSLSVLFLILAGFVNFFTGVVTLLVVWFSTFLVVGTAVPAACAIRAASEEFNCDESTVSLLTFAATVANFSLLNV